MMQLVREQNRQVPRQVLAKQVQATIAVGGQQYEGTLVDYSLKGFGLSVDPGAIKRAQRDGWNVEIGIAGGKYAGTVKHSRLENHRALLGVNLKAALDTEKVAFTNEDPGWDLIQDEKTITNLVTDLHYKGPQVLLELKQLGVVSEAFVSNLDQDGVLRLEIFSHRKGSLAAGRTKVTFEIFQTCHAFESSILKVDEKYVDVEIPKQVARLLRRETVRVPNGLNDITLKLEVSSSLLGKAPGEVKLFDYSEHGISIIEPTGWAYAPAGIPFEQISLKTPQGETIEGSGKVRGHRWIPELEAYVIGLDFEAATLEDRTRWHNAILSARYPNLAFNYGDKDHQGIWDLFDRSGYLDLKPRESFNYVFDVSKKTWKQLSDAGTKMSKRVQIKKDNQIMGHLQLDRIYPKTWCVHSLAIDPATSKTVGKDIYSVTADVLSAEGGGYVISITESDLGWNQRNYYDFVNAYRFPEHNELKTFQIHEAETSKGWNLKKLPEMEVRKANKFDLRRIVKYFSLYGSKIESEALGLLNEDDLLMKEMQEEFKPYGIERSREFVVGMIDNQLVGFASLETGTAGLTIFGIQDTMYVYLMPELGSKAQAIYEGLLDAALERYRELGVATVNIYMQENRREYYSERGLKFIWEGVRWLAKRVVSRRYHAYTQMLYGHLLLKRESIHRKRTKR